MIVPVHVCRACNKKFIKDQKVVLIAPETVLEYKNGEALVIGFDSDINKFSSVTYFRFHRQCFVEIASDEYDVFMGP